MKKLSTLLVFVLSVLISSNASALPKLNSFPGASAVVFLDFDGHYVHTSFWNNGHALYCAPATMSDAQITEAWGRVAEDFKPFMVNITTDSTVFLAAALDRRQRIIITPTSAWQPDAGGVAYVGSFTWGDDTPGFVFCDQLGPNSPKMVGEAISHETGHTVGLSHQSRYGADCTTPSEYYHSGNGSGEIGWSPIMGVSYYRNVSNWNNGPTPYTCTNTQDNLSIITTTNGFGYRPDDYGQTLDNNTFDISGNNLNASGIITTNSDVDAFSFMIDKNSNIHLSAVPGNVANGWIGANLDIKLELYNNAGVLIGSYDPAWTLSVTVDTVLTTGKYYVKIDGTGNTNIGEYGSLGSYTLSGTTGALPIHDVALVGTVNKAKHDLNWNIIADEPIRSIEIQTSNDGLVFNKLTNALANSTKYSFTPNVNNTIYYRLKVTSVTDQIVYSNIVALKSNTAIDKSFFVSTFIHNDITVNATEKYDYRLMDMNGRIVVTGSGISGVNKISAYNLPNGMYIIQLSSNNHQQTERIVRQ
jgi:hypothetical protein